jgi:hypothetical protein
MIRTPILCPSYNKKRGIVRKQKSNKFAKKMRYESVIIALISSRFADDNTEFSGI